MSVIQHALNDIRYKIPKRVLNLAFVPRVSRLSQTYVDVPEQIMSLVIRPRVLVDLNVVGGQEVFIPLDQAHVENLDPVTSVFRIPKELTDGRSIISVKSINYISPSSIAIYGSVAQCNRGSIMTGAKAMMDAMSDMPPVSTSEITLIGENVVMVKHATFIPPQSQLRCVIEYDSDMNQINPRSFKVFSHLVMLAVQAYIYQMLVIDMDEGYLQGGAELGSIMQFVNKYEGAEDAYTEYLTTKVQKVLFLNDDEKVNRMMRWSFGGNR